MKRTDTRDFDDPMVINLHDKHVAERMPVHLARTEADLSSAISKHAVVVAAYPVRITMRPKLRRIA